MQHLASSFAQEVLKLGRLGLQGVGKVDDHITRLRITEGSCKGLEEGADHGPAAPQAVVVPELRHLGGRLKPVPVPSLKPL